MSLTFYYAPMSTASTVHWTLEELGVPYEGVLVDLSSESDKQQKLGPVNPNLKVPVLVHDGHVIFESAAIQIYLGETFGVERGLYPAPGPARGDALKWLVWTNVSLGDAVLRWQHHTSEQTDAKLQNTAAGVEARKDVDKVLAMLEVALDGRSYLLGDGVTLVDFHLVSFLQWAAFCGVKLAPFPRVSAWVERCSERPASLALMAG